MYVHISSNLLIKVLSSIYYYRNALDIYIYCYYIILNIAQVICQSCNPLAFILNASKTYLNDIKKQKQTKIYDYHNEI